MSGSELGAGAQVAAAAEAVQEVELRRRQRQASVLVLPEERDQPSPDRLEVRRGGGSALNERPRAALGAHPPGEHDLGRFLFDALAQLGQLRLVQQAGGQLEGSFHVGLACARPHDPRPRPAAKHEIERVSEDGLAGARLARDGRQPLPRAQLGALDQQEVLYAELEEHQPGLPARPDGETPL